MMVRFLADECFSASISTALQDAGIDVIRSANIIPAADDATILDWAFNSDRVLLTEDKDFGELTVRLGLPCRGVVRLALKPLAREARPACVLAALTSIGDSVRDALVTIEPARTRVRRFKSQAEEP